MELFKLFGSIVIKDGSGKQLDDIEKKAKEADFSISSLGKTCSSIGEGITKVGTSITKFLTVPLIGAAAAALKVGNDFDAQMSRVKAIAGATEKEFKSLRSQAIQLGGDTAFSAKQAAEGMENLASAGFSTSEIMAAMPGMLDLAASSGEGLASSADIAASTLRGFGLEASQAAHVADVLARAAADTNAGVADTGEAMKYVAPVAYAMGLSLEEVTAAIGEMSNAGIKGSQAGTTLRAALTRLANPSKKAAKLMKQLGFDAYDSQGKMLPLKDLIANLESATNGLSEKQKQQAIATIFGQEAMSGMLTLMQAGSEELDNLTNSLKSSNGAASEMAAIMQDNTKSAIEQMMGSLETLSIRLKDVLDPKIKNIIQTITGFINKLSDLDSQQLKSILSFGGLAAAMGPGLTIFGKITEGTGSFLKVLDEGSSKIGEFASSGIGKFKEFGSSASALMSNLSNLTVFQKLGSKFAELGSNFEWMAQKIRYGSNLTPIIDGIGNKVSGSITKISSIIPSNVQTSFNRVFGVINTGAPKVAGALGTVGGKVFSGLQSMVGLALKMIAPAALIGVLLLGLGVAQQQMGTQLDNVISMITQKGPILIQNFTAGLLAKIPTLIDTGTTLLMNLVNALIANAPNLITAAVAVITSLVDGVSRNLPRLIPMVLQLIQTILMSILDNLPKLVMAGLNLLVSLAQGISNNTGKIVNTITTVLTKLISVIAQNLPQIINAGIKILVALVQGISGAIPKLIAALPKIFSAIWNGLKNMDWGSIGRNIIEGIKDGVKAMASGLANSVKEAAKGALNGVKRFLGIQSPSRKFRDEIGKFIPAGIAVGIEDNRDIVNDELGRLANDLVFDPDLGATVSASYTGVKGGNNIESESDDNIKSSNKKDVNITVNNYSPEPLDEYESARQTAKALRKMGYAF